MNPLGALQFLTVLPVRTNGAGSGAAWYPMVGALLGGFVAAVCWAVPSQGPLLALALLAAVTGGLHEDGLADVCDALRAYRSREKMLPILHDSRIGAHGALGLIFSVLIRWQALSHVQGNLWLRLPVAIAISRGSMVLNAALLPSASSGLGQHFKDSLTPAAVIAVAVQLGVACVLLGWPAGVFVLASQAVLVLTLSRWFQARLGGFNGDCLGFTCQVSEAAAFVVLANL